MLVSRRRSGACSALRWDGQRYRCGVLADSRGWRARWMTRWSAAGAGCDSSAEVAAPG
jgi:hypothetical protein